MLKSQKIGVLGGCIVSGFQEVTPSNCFYQVLRKRYGEENRGKLGVRLKVYGRFYHPDYVSPCKALEGYDDLEMKVEKMIGQNVKQIIFVLRPALHWSYCKFVSREDNKLYLHPSLGGTENAIGGYWPARILNKVFNVIFKLTGSRFSFINKSNELFEKKLKVILNKCVSSGVGLIMLKLDIPTYEESYKKRLNKFLRHLELTSLSEAKWVDLELSEKMFFDDGFHLNIEGHRHIADKIYPLLK